MNVAFPKKQTRLLWWKAPPSGYPRLPRFGQGLRIRERGGHFLMDNGTVYFPEVLGS